MTSGIDFCFDLSCRDGNGGGAVPVATTAQARSGVWPLAEHPAAAHAGD